LGAMGVKAVRKYVGEIEPRSPTVERRLIYYIVTTTRLHLQYKMYWKLVLLTTVSLNEHNLKSLLF